MPRPKILLVDDTKLFLEVEKDFLRGFAVAVYTATSGRDALALLGMLRPDLVFMDLYMPEMDGASCCAFIKRDPDLRSIPVVMVSVPDNEGEIRRCREAGCDGILISPVDRQDFLRFGQMHLPDITTIEHRAPCRAQVVFRVNNVPCYAKSVDVSSHGMYIAFHHELVYDDQIQLSFLLPDSKEQDLVEAVGRVAWVNTIDDSVKPTLPPGFGVEFTWLAPQALERIHAFIQRAVADDTMLRVEPAYFIES